MNAKEFPRRRRQLARMMGRNSIAILRSAPERIRNRDAHYPYRQDSDFYYLTGFGEPDAVAVLAPGRTGGEFLLFCRERDPAREVWDGERAGPEGAVADFGADDAFPVADMDDILPGLMENCDRVYYTMGRDADFDQRIIGWVNRLRRSARGDRAPQEFVALEHPLHELRLFKSPAERRALRRSARIAADAHKRVLRTCRPGLREFEVEAELVHEFRRHNTVPAYQPIVGAGCNACVLHYHRNDATLRDGDLLLVDAGCEHDYYASDITRTFPVNGHFSAEQRAIYEVVLAAQRAAIEQVRPGNDWNDPHTAAVRAITTGLVRLGLLKGTPAARIRDGSYTRFFMHKTGHWLGMDVHDVGDYKVSDQWRVLEPGMVMTVEPGVYIPHGSRGVARKWWDIGIRIEDDVLVTRDAPEVLSRHVPTDPDAIEALMSAAARDV